MPSRAHLRASDADRERAADLLRQARVEGRLLTEELEQRLEAAFRARTYGQLERLVADLPGPRRRRRRVAPLAAVLLVAPVVIVLVSLLALLMAGVAAGWSLWLVVGWWLLVRRRRRGRGPLAWSAGRCRRPRVSRTHWA